MAVFRVERNKGYTVMSNHHLRNKELTLKAKGLLSQMLSLPEDWDYTLAGLSQINRESIDATRPLWLTTWQAAHLRQRSRTPPIHSNRAKACNHPQPQKEDFIMAQKMTGALVFDERTDRYDIRFDLASYYGGLHCGDCFDVFTRGKWKPTRIEMNMAQEWYLVGIRADDLNGLRVRI